MLIPNFLSRLHSTRLATILLLGLIGLGGWSMPAVLAGVPDDVLVITEQIKDSNSQEISELNLSEVIDLPTGDIKETFLPKVARIMLYVMSTVTLVIFIVSGAILIFGFGNQEKLKTAKLALTWGIVGLAFSSGAYALIRGVIEFQLEPEISVSDTVPAEVGGAATEVANGEEVDKEAEAAAEEKKLCEEKHIRLEKWKKKSHEPITKMENKIKVLESQAKSEERDEQIKNLQEMIKTSKEGIQDIDKQLAKKC